MARIEKDMLSHMSPRHSASNANEASFEENARQPLLEQQDQIQIDMASEQALRAEENEAEIRLIERDVAELNDMFKDMSFLVEQQQETLDCIEDNIASTATYTRQGYNEVEKAQAYQRRSRSRMCKLLLLLLVIVTIAVLVVVGIIKS